MIESINNSEPTYLFGEFWDGLSIIILMLIVGITMFKFYPKGIEI